jgi:hypothetical protein
MLSEANLQTAQASELLAQLCRQFQSRAAAHPDLGIAIQSSEMRSSVDFGWARCVLEASPDALHLRVEADQADDLERLQELLTRHLEHHSSSEQVAVLWSSGGDPAASPRDPRRKDLMRSFHRRARGASSGH